jgi:predicted 2-oxoglutarate/Fe(II)-dependent dioxygenase YbiX
MDIRVREQLLKTLMTIDRPGTFCTSGRLPSTLPGLEVTDLGPVALPLEKRQAAALKKLARQAPYGKGTKTLVDTNVRRVWELDAHQVSLANPEWQDAVDSAVRAVQSALGLENQNLDAHLYKLLLYEAGSFFLPHRDGEKLDRMVATLVIALPSAHEGGELIVRHEGREETIDFGPESRFRTQFAAFYADCEHEVRPVTSGFRLALVYNLTLAKSKQAITAPTSGDRIVTVARLLRQWLDEKDSAKADVEQSTEQRPITKLAVLLDHEYTQAGLTHDVLKGIDRAKADVLFAAARQAGCDASLALVTKWVSGSAEPSGDYGYGYSRSRRRGRYGYDDDDDENDADGEHEMGEVFDESLTAEHFCDANGNRLAFGQIPLDDEEVLSETPLSERKPDKEDFEGYTGNAGMTLERWYHRAAIVLWPAESRFDVLCEAGVEAAVGGLEQMVRRWKHARKSEQAAFQTSCLEFARRIIAYWQEGNYRSSRFVDYGGGNYDVEEDGEDDEELFCDEDFEGDDPGDFAEDRGLQQNPTPSQGVRRPLLSLLEELGDVSLIAAWLRGVLAKDVSVDPGRTLGNLCQQHGWRTFQDELRELFESTSNQTLERHARLLADWSLRKDKDTDGGRLCSELARQLISAVECWDPGQAKRDWRARAVDRCELLTLLMQAFLAMEEPELLERLTTYVLDRPKEFDLTTVQVPAWLRLETWLEQSIQQSSSPLHCWLSAVHDELKSRASHPPLQPVDWRRESATGCDCADCRELSRFLDDPNKQTLRLPIHERRRQHLHQIIDEKKLDTTHVTERQGRPYTLVCTKTKASYERALEAHYVDLDHLKKTGKLLAWHARLPSKPDRPESKASKVPKKKRT